jgi:hypothetical protein
MKPKISRLLSFFDFWLSDFSWYRKLTKGKWQWYRCSTIGDTPLVQVWWKRDDDKLFTRLKMYEEQFSKQSNNL